LLDFLLLVVTAVTVNERAIGHSHRTKAKTTLVTIISRIIGLLEIMVFCCADHRRLEWEGGCLGFALHGTCHDVGFGSSVKSHFEDLSECHFCTCLVFVVELAVGPALYNVQLANLGQRETMDERLWAVQMDDWEQQRTKVFRSLTIVLLIE
jgi:hypothetical protein